MSFLQQEKMGNMNERHFNMITKVGGFFFYFVHWVKKNSDL